MIPLFFLTIKGILRDKVFRGIIVVSALFLIIPSVSSLSMRQVTELSISLVLSLTSFVLLMLAIFLGGTSLWKDIERRFTYSVLSLPLTRASYVMGKYLGNAFFILVTTLILACIGSAVIGITSSLHPPQRPVMWTNVCLALSFGALKYCLLIAVAFLFSSISTSFFLPIFGTISVFIAGSAVQEVHDFLQSTHGQEMSPMVKIIAGTLYYVLPNFAAFDLHINAIYGLRVSYSSLVLTFLYFAIYTALLLLGTVAIYSHREMK